MAEELKLPDTALDDLNRANELISALESFTYQAEQAGHDVSEAKKFIETNREAVRRHKNAFFPGK